MKHSFVFCKGCGWKQCPLPHESTLYGNPQKRLLSDLDPWKLYILWTQWTHHRMGLFPLAAEKAQTQVCSPPQLMHVLNWRQTLRVWCWLWFHLFLPLCSSAFLIYFTFILLHYMHPWSYPKSSFEAKWSRNKLKKKKGLVYFTYFVQRCKLLLTCKVK